MSTKKRTTTTTCAVKTEMDLLQQTMQETVAREQLPKQRLTMLLVTEKLCCGVYERQSTIEVEAYQEGDRLFFNPVQMPTDWDRFKMTCTRGLDD